MHEEGGGALEKLGADLPLKDGIIVQPVGLAQHRNTVDAENEKSSGADRGAVSIDSNAPLVQSLKGETPVKGEPLKLRTLGTSSTGGAFYGVVPNNQKAPPRAQHPAFSLRESSRRRSTQPEDNKWCWLDSNPERLTPGTGQDSNPRASGSVGHGLRHCRV